MSMKKRSKAKILIGTLAITSGINLYAGTADAYNAAGNEVVVTENMESKTKQEKTNEFLKEARKVNAEEKNTNLKGSRKVNAEKDILKNQANEVFLYQVIDDESNELYYYENAMGKETVDIFKIENKQDLSKEIRTMANLKDGIGGRQFIQASNNGTLQTTVKLPQNITNLKGNAFIYTGFTGSVESDAGLQYNPNINAWVPYLKVDGHVATDNKEGNNFTPGYDQVQFKNGFAPGADITFVFDSNYNGSGFSRLKQMGYAKHKNAQGEGSTTHLTSIISAQRKTGSIKNFKVLCTVAGTAEMGENVSGCYSAEFKNITFNGAPAKFTSSADEDWATVSRNGNNVSMYLYKK